MISRAIIPTRFLAKSLKNTKNIKKRLDLHNTSKGAKFTKGRVWKLAYFKSFKSKNLALKEEYKLKKDYNLRNRIKKEFINNENSGPSSI